MKGEVLANTALDSLYGLSNLEEVNRVSWLTRRAILIRGPLRAPHVGLAWETVQLREE